MIFIIYIQYMHTYITYIHTLLTYVRVSSRDWSSFAKELRDVHTVNMPMVSSRIYTESKGKSNPVASNATAEGRAKNRRTDIEVVGTSAVKK